MGKSRASYLWLTGYQIGTTLLVTILTVWNVQVQFFLAIILLLSTKLFVFTAGMKYVQSQQ